MKGERLEEEERGEEDCRAAGIALVEAHLVVFEVSAYEVHGGLTDAIAGEAATDPRGGFGEKQNERERLT